MHARRTHVAPSRQLIDAMMDGYVRWREASAAAASAYQDWRSTSPGKDARAFESYRAALDREESAAANYQRLLEMVQTA
jgi:hypothetical protein